MLLYRYTFQPETSGALPKEFETTGDGGSVTIDATMSSCGAGGSIRVDNLSGGNIGCSVAIPVERADVYRRVRVKFDYRSQDLKRGVFWWYCGRGVAYVYDDAGKLLNPHDNSVGSFFADTSDWKAADRTIVIPPNAASIKLALVIENATGTAWFDNISVSMVPNDYKPEEQSRAEVVVDPNATVGEMAFGFGWNWEFTSINRYPKGDTVNAVSSNGNWRFSSWHDFPDVENRFFDQLFSYARWDGQSFVRMGVDVSHFAPRNYEPGQDHGQDFDYDFDTPYIKQDCKALDFFEERNIHVLLANWGTGADQLGVKHGNWLRKGYYEMTDQANSDWFLPYSYRRWAEAVAALVHYFRVVRGYKCVKYVSMCNEPNGPWTVEGVYPEKFFRMHDLLAEELEKRGIRDSVQIVAAESVEPGTAAEISVDATEKWGQKSVDVVSTHDYDHGLGFAVEDVSQSDRMDVNIEAYEELARRLDGMHGRRIPLLCGEFGGLGAWPTSGGRHLYLCTLSSAEFALRCLNVGVEGFLRWVYDHPGDIQHTVFHVEDGSIKPNGGLYYPWAVLSRWTSRGSSVLRAQVSGGTDAEGLPRVRAAALRLPNGDLTTLLTNTGSEPKSVTITGLPESRWSHYECSMASHEGLSEKGVAVDADGSLVIDLAAESVSALTSSSVGLTGNAAIDADSDL